MDDYFFDFGSSTSIKFLHFAKMQRRNQLTKQRLERLCHKSLISMALLVLELANLVFGLNVMTYFNIECKYL